MSNKSKSNTLSDKISELLTSVPKSFDPEDDVHEETLAKVVEQDSDDEIEQTESTSRFRRQNVDLLEDVDNRYKGKRTSRKDLIDSDEFESENEGDGSDKQSLENTSENDESDSGEANSDISEEEDEGDEESENDEEQDSDANSSNFKHLSLGDNSKAEKGRCVRNQLNLWESLLEMRIQLQKTLITANKMPQVETHRELSINYPEFNSKVKETANTLKTTLEKFLTLQMLLQKQFTETKSLNKEEKAKEESDKEIPSDTEEENLSSEEEVEEEKPKKRRKLEDFEEEIRSRHDKYSKYRNGVIQKWHDKTKLMSGKKSVQHSVIDQINYILNDKQRLIKRTQLKRSQYDIVGKIVEEKEEVNDETEVDRKLEEEYDEQIFDDDDFYHQLLRELIEVKSADLTDPVQLGKQWIELQNLRSKMKRKIDTRATKGRKIRYTVHNKLVNFMAPIEESLNWTDEAKTELYSSLFGKNQIEIENQS